MSRSPHCGWGFLCIIATLFCVSLLGCGDDGVPSTVAESASPPGAATLDEELPSPAEPTEPAASVDSPDSGTQASSTDPTPASAGSPSPAQLLPQEAETEVTPPQVVSPAPDENAGAAGSPEPVTDLSEAPPSDSVDNAQSLDDLLTAVEIPPAWLADVRTSYDTSNPWKEARLEIRRLLSLGEPASHREAIKLTWIYLQKDDIGDGHEYPMYTFLGGEPLWSIRAHQQFIAKPHENTPFHSLFTLAKLYVQFGEFEKAKTTLDTATQGLPDPPWKIMRQAELEAAYGDLYAAWNRVDEAKQRYARAARLYPTAKPPYGGHLLPRHAADAQAKLDLLMFRSLETANLRDGQYHDIALGYAGNIDLTVTIQGGKIADVKVRHEEKIDQNACVLIPQRIMDQQSLQVDGISGATVTKDAIVNGVYRCLKKAGLR